MAIRVLLADPERVLLDAYRDFLTRDGFEVKTASNGADCLTKLREWKPDVLVLEPDTPNGWGESILDEVSHHPEQTCPRVLILSRRDREMAAYPVREYHVKPFPMAELAKSIRAAVDHRRASAP